MKLTALGLGIQLYYAVMTICLVIQLAMGANVLLLIAMAIIAGLTPIGLLGRQLEVSDFLFAILGMYLAGLALIIKTTLGQTIDSNLHSVIDTSMILLTFFCTVLVAYLCAKQVRSQINFKPLFQNELQDEGFLRFFARYGFMIGFVLHAAHLVLRPQYIAGTSLTTEGFGGFGEFYFLMLFGFVAQVYCATLKKTRGEYLLVAAMFLCFVAAAFLGNIKKDIFDASVVIAVATVAFGLRVKPSVIVVGGAFIMFVTFVATPVIHITRSTHTTDVFERIGTMSDILAQNNWDLGRINEINEAVTMGYQFNYSSYGSYVYPSTANLDRFALILPIDQVARVEDAGRVAFADVVQRAAENVLPSFLIAKSGGAIADQVAWTYGFRQFGSVARPVVGLAAASYAVGGWLGVIVLGFLCIFFFYLVADLVSGPINRSVLAVGMLVFMVQMAEKEPDALISFVIRTVPVILLTMFALIVTYRSVFRRVPQYVRSI